MVDLDPRYQKFLDDRKKQGLPLISYEEWHKNYRKVDSERLPKEVVEIIKLLNLESDNPNYGTKNKQRLMTRSIALLYEFKEGKYDDLANRLSLRLGIAFRTAKENYIEPLISEGILEKVGSQVTFIGLKGCKTRIEKKANYKDIESS